MMLFSLHKTRPMCVAVLTVAVLGWGEAKAEEPRLFDLEWDGAETSTVEECVGGDSFCYTFPITGSLGVGLEAGAPQLFNVASDILLPPQTPNAPPAISPNLWFNFDLLEGKYLPTDNDDDVSMVFRPAEIGSVLRAFEIVVSITDGGQSLELTGGIEQIATSPLEPNVRFSVSGRLIASESGAADLVDGFDFLELQRGYHATSVFPALDRAEDGVVTGADFQQWRAEYGTTGELPATASVHAVPEASTFVLATLLAVAELTYFARRRND